MPDPTVPSPGSVAAPSSVEGLAALGDVATLEQAAAATAGAPDVAAIARLANALFTALPGSAPLEPGAALGSAPLFAAEPLLNAVPGTPPVTPLLSAEQQSRRVVADTERRCRAAISADLCR
ncbi:MAG: hypothetical protein MZV49_18815 [Rhodopseudomonas palustris]|nr:hypothetical protein [Rhodopseudomonas palustris]